MSCQQASRVQEDPYAFTEPAPLPANTSLYKHSHAVSSTISTTSTTAAAAAVAITAAPVIQAGTSLLTSNNSGAHNAIQNRTSGTPGKVTPIKVTLVQPMGKPRLNGSTATTMTTSPSGTVFRTVSVPQATTIVHRSPSQVMVTAGTNNTTTPSTVFTKPLQVQISPQQTGKFSRRVLASKSPNVSPAAIQTVRIVKSPSLQQPIGGRPTITPDARRYLNHSSNSLLGPPPATTPVAPPAPLQSVSPTKIRLIQPQPQGKIFLHTPNSSNSLAAATHISNPASIAALRNSLARQNPSLLNKVPITIPQQISSSNSTVLPTVRQNTATSTTINIRRTSPPTSQMSLETATTTVPPPPPSPIPATTAPVISPANLLAASKSIPQNPQAITQRSRTPTTSILKPPQPAQSASQEDIGLPIPSFVIHKQADPLPPPASPLTPIATDTKPIAPVITPSTPKTSVVATAGTSSTTATTPSTPKTQGKGRPSQADRSSTAKTAQHQHGTTGKRMKRSYSRSSHHETLERIPAVTTTTMATAPGPQVKDEQEDSCESKAQPATVRLSKWKPPGAIAIPMNREWHAPDSYAFDICTPGSVSYSTLSRAPCVQDVWFNEIYASTEMDTDAAAAMLGGMRPRKVGRKTSGEDQNGKLLLNFERDRDGGELKKLSRDERLELKRALLRRKTVQYWNGQKLRASLAAKKRFRDVEKMLSKIDHQREMALKRNGGVEQPKCQRLGCGQVALLATTHCYQHITDNSEQRLFQQCTAKFSDNSQCRVPVFDISHELILCREHAWKHDNHDKMSAEVKLLKKPGAGTVVAKKKQSVKQPIIATSARTAGTTTTTGNPKKKSKKKKLTPLQQQLALHQQQYKQQYSNVNHSKPTLPPPAYGTVSGASSTVQIVPKTNTIRQTTGSLLQQPLQQMSQGNPVAPGVVQIVPPQSTISRNVHIPLSQQLRQLQQPLSLGTTYQHLSSQPILQQQHMIGRNDDLMLNFAAHQQQQQAPFNQQHVQQMLSGAITQDLLNICENSSAYASSEDTGVGGLSESELMAAQDVIEEIPFEIGNLNNVLSQLPPDAFNELLFSEQEQNGPTFESTQEEEEDLERALEVVGEHVKSLEDMTVESANFLGDFLDNVDDEMLNGSDICSDQMLQSPNTNDIRGLVHT
ncbi:mucin-5AC isoform X2 [Ochlerotatus camptorhynchus]|uniref:mucin-5AC isoform X2 n=1 Tax=Ochlerotatus camptorhynchus TaxID=644619 RepID=UPI0031DCBEC7